MGEDGPIVEDLCIAESFCKFYTQVGPSLASKIKAPLRGSFKNYLSNPSVSSAAFLPTTPQEIQHLCQALDGAKSPGYDSVAPSILRYVSKEVSGPLSRLINVCIEVGHFPDYLKIAKVIPVFKSSDPTQFGNYRPVSVLPVVSKIFERVIQQRLLSFFQRKGSILSSQYGFRKGHSTYMAIMDMVENIRTAWENGEHCLGLFIDFKKAFDTVDHHILVDKLEHLGIRGTPLDLVRSYLKNRNQYVVFNGTESSRRNISVGVPQGSILGPQPFSVMVYFTARAFCSRRTKQCCHFSLLIIK